MDYQRASQEFEAFLAEAKEALDFTTRNPTYTTIQGVLLAFRRRLSAEQVLAFAALLPPMLRAMFVADWTPREHVVGFPSAEDLAGEVQALRRNHNFSPDNSIEVVARILRRHVDEAAFERLLRTLPEGARAFWYARASLKQELGEVRVKENEMSELTDLYVTLLKAWNDRDAKAMTACFDDEAVMIGFDGSTAEGKAAIEAQLAPIFKDHPTAAYTAILRSTHVYGDIQLLRADAGMLPPGKHDIKSETIARQTIVARRTEAGLRIVQFQNTAIALDQDKAGRAAIYDQLQEALKSGEILQR